MKNIWRDYAAQLGPAYARSADNARFALVTHALGTLNLPKNAPVLDIGGGFGRQARLLAETGLNVTIVDIDDFMLAQARLEIAQAAPDISAKICLIQQDIFISGSAPEPTDAILSPSAYELVCCHSLLNYLEDLETALTKLVAYIRPGGYLSLLVNMPKGLAIREFLRGQTQSALQILNGQSQNLKDYIADYHHEPEQMITHLKTLGLALYLRHGVGFFSEMNPFRGPGLDVLDNICLLDWCAGQDPNLFNYCTAHHIIMRKT